MTAPAGSGRPGRAARPARPHVTGRAAVLVIVLCAIALSLAYPVREYISERRQIDQLEAQQSSLRVQVRQLQLRSRQLANYQYIERQARDLLHMCWPNDTCYEVINTGHLRGTRSVAATVAATPWYERLWSSVQHANAVSRPRHAVRPRQR